MARWFAKLASHTANLAGHYVTFIAAVLVILIWVGTGPLFNYHDTWQIVINTGTTIVTFLMVFLIQNTQNRDARAMHLKLDELIKSIENADNAVIRAEDETDEELKQLKEQYERLCSEHAALKEQLGHHAANGAAPTPTRAG